MNWGRFATGFIVFVIVACVLTALFGCSSGPNYSDESEYAEVCISNQTGTRVDDTMCASHSGLPPQPWFVYYWYPIHYYAVPPIGGVATTGYVRERPANVTVKRAAPRGSAAPLPYSDAEKKKRRDAAAKQQAAWQKQQKQSTWKNPPVSNGGTYKPPTTTYKPPTTTSRPR